MISLIVPTRNREHTLRKVVASYFEQDDVDEIVIVNDGGEDGSVAFVRDAARSYPEVHLVVVSNASRCGAAACRNRGVEVARNRFVLFVDDDEYLEKGYARTCLQKLTTTSAGAVSGRRIYMLGQETQDDALRRFQTGFRNTSPFNRWLCEYVNGAKYSGDIEMPLTNAIILTEKALVLEHPFDEFYNKGNGYREESDFQMHLFVSGKSILVTNSVHSFHLPMQAVRTGGQRTNRLKRIYWSVYFTRHFYAKYFDAYRHRVGLPIGRHAALALFAAFSAYRELIRPYLYMLAMALRRARASGT